MTDKKDLSGNNIEPRLNALENSAPEMLVAGMTVYPTSKVDGGFDGPYNEDIPDLENELGKIEYFHDETQYTLSHCPHCGSTTAPRLMDANELNGYKDEIQQDSSLAVVCDASTLNKLGGCGAMGGYARTSERAVRKWNGRADKEAMSHNELTDNVIRMEDALKKLESMLYHKSSFARMREGEKNETK